MRRSALSPRRRLLAFVCAAAWAAALIVSHIPSEDMPSMEVGDPTLHVVGYAVLAALLWLTLRAYGTPAGRRTLWTLAAMAAYSALDELTQPLFGRSAELMDWTANMAGAGAGLLGCACLAGLCRGVGRSA